MYTNKNFDILIDKRKHNRISNKDFIIRLILFEENSSNLNEERRFLVYLNLCKSLSIDNDEQDLERALKYCKRAESLLNEKDDQLKAELFHNQGHIYARKKEFKKSELSFLNYIHFLNKVNCFPFYADSLYSFRKITRYVLSDLINQEVTIINPKGFNDPFDTLLFHFLKYRRQMIKYDIKPLIAAFRFIKIRCFVKDHLDSKKKEKVWAFRNLLMWSHYANSHKGICIRYKFDPSPYSVVNHHANNNISSKWLEIKYHSNVSFKDDGKEDLNLLYATKNECWEYEKEVRLVHFDPDCEGKYKKLPLLEIGGKIEAVFFGIKCSTRNKDRIKKILEGKNVEFFDFKSDTLYTCVDIYKLELEDEERFKKLDQEIIVHPSNLLKQER